MKVCYTKKKNRNDAIDDAASNNYPLIESLSSFLDSYVRTRLNAPSLSIEEQLVEPLFLRYNAYESYIDESSQDLKCPGIGNLFCWCSDVAPEVVLIHTSSLRDAMDMYAALFYFYTVNALEEDEERHSSSNSENSAMIPADLNQPQTFQTFLQENDASDDTLENISMFEFMFSEEAYFPFQVPQNTDALLEDMYSFQPFVEKTFGHVLFNGPMPVLFMTTVLCLLVGTHIILRHTWNMCRPKQIDDQA